MAECDYCMTEGARRHTVDEEPVWLCRDCWEDVIYCERGGKEPAEP